MSTAARLHYTHDEYLRMLSESAFKPATGSSCAGIPGGTTCDYPPGAPCPEPCVCGADGVFHCAPTPCDAGGFDDGGPVDGWWGG